MRAIIYARCSTDHQTQENGGVSIENQIERCKEYVERRNWTLVDTIVDEDVSGGINKKRTGFISLLDRVEQNGIDVVVLYSLERLSRDMLTLLALEKLLNEYDVMISTVDGCIDTSTVDGFMSFAMKAFLGEMERRQVKYRTKKALEHKKSQGHRTGTIPYGYSQREVPVEGRKKPLSVLDPNPVEQETIRIVNKLYSGGTRLKDIVNHLNDEGRFTRTSNPWTPGQVRRLIEDYQPCFKKSVTRLGAAARQFIEAIA